jgi:hypothetical protein
MDDVVKDSSKVILGYGVLGVVCLGLVLALVFLVKTLGKKDAEIARLNELRIAEAKAYSEVILRVNLDWASLKDHMEEFLERITTRRTR